MVSKPSLNEAIQNADDSAALLSQVMKDIRSRPLAQRISANNNLLVNEKRESVGR
jgi:hypothetical protein